MNNKGVYISKTKNGDTLYRASITFRNRHISLGSYSSQADANNAYLDADLVLHSDITLEEYSKLTSLPHDKFISLINYRDNNVYIKNPIYLRKNYFFYYFNQSEIFTFDIDDLFYYSNHKIQKRGGRFFCADFGMQITLSSRYGIKNHAVIDRDYIFINGDCYDFRYDNINIINRYSGVRYNPDKEIYKVYIHINGDFIVGSYKDEATAAIAYNKAADYLNQNGISKKYQQNYIENIGAKDYAEIYSSIDLSTFIKKLST